MKKSATSLVARVAAVAAVSAFVPVLASQQASAAPVDPVIAHSKPLSSISSPNGSKITALTVGEGRSVNITVHSASMNRDIPLSVLRPVDTSKPRPTLYLLNGADGGEGNASWQAQTDIADFFSNKNVNVVSPMKGAYTYYTDWIKPDPVLGVNKWSTFLTEEVPPLINAGLGTNGINSIAGLSSSGTSVLQLATAKKGLFKGVAAYSGCAQTSDPFGQSAIKIVVESRGQGNTDNMWGPPNDPRWRENDMLVNADRLRGLDIYLASGSGLPGPHDTLTDPRVGGDVGFLANQIALGGIIEAGTNYCSHNLADRLNQLNIPATVNFPPYGTHSWGYWQDDLKLSWPVLAHSLGI